MSRRIYEISGKAQKSLMTQIISRLHRYEMKDGGQKIEEWG
jgi:hypothetical protein